MDKSQEKESQNRIDSIIALMMEEARSLKNFVSIRTQIYHVLWNVHARVMEIMRTME